MDKKRNKNETMTSANMHNVDRLLRRLHLRKINEGADIGQVANWLEDQSKRVAGIASDDRRRQRVKKRQQNPNPLLDGDDCVLEALEFKIDQFYQQVADSRVKTTQSVREKEVVDIRTLNSFYNKLQDMHRNQVFNISLSKCV